jgi:hypothetical protein
MNWRHEGASLSLGTFVGRQRPPHEVQNPVTFVKSHKCTKPPLRASLLTESNMCRDLVI